MKPQTLLITLCLMLFVAFSSSAQSKIRSTYAGKTSGDITKEELLSDSVVRFNYADSLGTHQATAASFKISIIQRGRDPILDIPSDGGKMSPKIKGYIMELHAGDKLFFEYLKLDPNVNLPRRASLDPIAFTIVDQ